MSVKFRTPHPSCLRALWARTSLPVLLVGVAVVALALPAAAAADRQQLRQAKVEFSKDWDAWTEDLDYQLDATAGSIQICERAEKASSPRVKAALWSGAEATVEAIDPGMKSLRALQAFKPRLRDVSAAKTGMGALSQADVVEGHGELEEAVKLFKGSANSGVRALWSVSPRRACALAKKYLAGARTQRKLAGSRVHAGLALLDEAINR